MFSHIIVMILEVVLWFALLRSMCYAQPVSATFKGDSVYFQNTNYDRSSVWAEYIGEAHSKFKFRPGTIYYNPWDTAEGIPVNKTYYQTYLKTDIERFRHVTGPDWTSFKYPPAHVTDFTFFTYFLLESSQKTPKYNKVGWNGGIHSPVAGRPEYYTRPLLLEYTANYSHLFCFQDINSDSKGRVELSDLIADYAYLLDIGGNGYSGRLKYLMWSNRPILYVDREYVEYFNEHLKPYVHYIPVKQDLTDLVSQTEWMMKNPEKASEIAANALDFAVEHLTHDAFIDRVGYVVNYLLDH